MDPMALTNDAYDLVLDKLSYADLLNMRVLSKAHKARIDDYLRVVAKRFRKVLEAHTPPIIGPAGRLSDDKLVAAAYHLTHPTGTAGAPTMTEMRSVISTEAQAAVTLRLPLKSSEVYVSATLFKCLYKGSTHRVGRPAEIYRPARGGGYDEWHHMGRMFREGGPACIFYYDDGRIEVETWYEDSKKDGRARLDGGPSLIKYNEDGTLRRESWFVGYNESRGDDLPARIDYIHRQFTYGRSYDIHIIIKQWMIDGVLHRVEGPAITVELVKDKANIVFYRAWMIAGLCHRVQQIDLGLDKDEDEDGDSRRQRLTEPFDITIRPDPYGPDVPKSVIYRDFLY